MSMVKWQNRIPKRTSWYYSRAYVQIGLVAEQDGKTEINMALGPWIANMSPGT